MRAAVFSLAPMGPGDVISPGSKVLLKSIKTGKFCRWAAVHMSGDLDTSRF